MFNLTTHAKHLAKRLVLLVCLTTIGALATAGTAMASDITAPTVSTPVQTVASTSQARVSWSGSDASGITKYQLMDYRWTEPCAVCGYGPSYKWVDVPLSSPTATSATTTVSDAHNHTFAIAAQDAAGNWSAWKLGPTIKQRVVQSPSLVNGLIAPWSLTGGWANHTLSSYSGGSTIYTYTVGNSARLGWSTNALNVALIGTKHPSAGSTKVKYTYNSVQAVDFPTYTVTQTASSPLYRQVLHQLRFGNATPGSVTVTANGGGFSDADAVVILDKQ
jgi:hypothetical protein